MADKTVLIVDDHRDFAENMAELARMQSLRPFIATGLKDALDWMRREVIDVATRAMIHKGWSLKEDRSEGPRRDRVGYRYPWEN